ncbi:MAG: Rpn family recombination-promoting nuclease/putative transposase [Candidatus Ornithomonoglobus sp.]
MELLSPKLDIVFKTLFTTKDSQDILSDFLASVLDIDAEDIKDIQIQNTELMPDSLEQKYSRLDIAMKVNDKLINVEMQVKKLKDFKERVLFYWAKLYTRDLKESEAYRKLRQTISINILDFNMFDCEECHSIFRLREETRNELFTDKCRFDFLELPKPETDNSEQVKRLRKWLRFFNMKTEEDAEMLTETNDRIMNKAVFILKQMSEDEKLREAARIRERALHDEASYIQDAIEDGMAKGLAQGRAEGIAEGRAEGIAENRNMMIESMRLAGIPQEQIDKVIAMNKSL